MAQIEMSTPLPSPHIHIQFLYTPYTRGPILYRFGTVHFCRRQTDGRIAHRNNTRNAATHSVSPKNERSDHLTKAGRPVTG